MPQPVSDTGPRACLRSIIAEKSYLTGGDFALASGTGSSFFFDMKPTLLDPEGATLVADLMLAILAEYNVTAVGGLVLGACPVASAICVRSFGSRQPLKGFYIRKEPKGRGTNKLFEGEELPRGSRIAIVEDVTTSGGSALKAVETARTIGLEVACVLTVIDRLQSADDAFRRAGIPFHALFTREDFADGT